MSRDVTSKSEFVSNNQIGINIYPFHVASPETIFSFSCSELLPGITLRRVPNGNLEEFQFIWDSWVSIRGSGFAEKWIRPNMMIVVDGMRYVPGILQRTNIWWPNRDLEKEAREKPMLFENTHIVSAYPVHRHLISCLLLLKGCSVSLLDGGFICNQDVDGNWCGGSFGPILPLKNLSREIGRTLRPDSNRALDASKLADLLKHTEIYYAPIAWSHDRIATALGAYWNFLTSPVYETAFLNLVTMIEALVGSNSGEITHQICERVARTIGTDLKTRKETYREIKTIYKHRSKLVHGDICPKKGPIGWNQPFLSAKSSAVNIHVFRDLVAKSGDLLLKLLATDDYVKNVRDGKPEDFDEYMLDLVLS